MGADVAVPHSRNLRKNQTGQHSSSGSPSHNTTITPETLLGNGRTVQTPAAPPALMRQTRCMRRKYIHTRARHARHSSPLIA